MTAKPAFLPTLAYLPADTLAMFPGLPYAVRTTDGRIFKRFATAIKAFRWLAKQSSK